VTTTPLHDDEQHMSPPQRGDPGPNGSPVDVAAVVRDFNAANQAHDRLWARTRHTADGVRRAIDEESRAREAARDAEDAHLAALAEHPHRRASLLQQVIIAACFIALDGVACWFAAQALGNAQLETLLWTALFLAVLAGGEVAMDYYSERSRPAWRLVLAALSAFVAGLGVLRFEYLATVGAVDASAALVGATLFTATTAGFVVIGYRALRAAETVHSWRARRCARRAARAAEAARNRLAAMVAERNRYIDAYLSRIRRTLLDQCTLDQLPGAEAVLRLHLCGHDPR
jgi:hypothetical protein